METQKKKGKQDSNIGKFPKLNNFFGAFEEVDSDELIKIIK